MVGIHDTARVEADPPRAQIRLIAAGGVLGAALLAASLVVVLTGANDASVPSRPTPSDLPTSLPTSLPSVPDVPTDLPTEAPSLPPIPTDQPSAPDLPDLPGGGS